MKRTKRTGAPVTSEVYDLGAELSFLDLVRATCARDGRFTMTADAGDSSFTVLVDRNGPFNAMGGGTTGSPALVKAAQLRQGRCTVSLGWPVDQPVYQPGLDMTLRALVEGVVEPQDLPRHRGVDSLRNQEWHAARTHTPEVQAPPPLAPPAEPVLASHRPTFPAPEAAVEPPVPVAPAPRGSSAAAVEADAPPAKPEPKPEPRMVWKQIGSRDVWTTETEPETVSEAVPARPSKWALRKKDQAVTDLPAAPAPAAALSAGSAAGTATAPAPRPAPVPSATTASSTPSALPPADGATNAGGPSATERLSENAREYTRRVLLWLVEVEDPENYSLAQAMAFARQELREQLAHAIHPFRQEAGILGRKANKRLSKIKQEWDESGEAAARVKKRKRGSTMRKRRILEDDPDKEFRL